MCKVMTALIGSRFCRTHFVPSTAGARGKRAVFPYALRQPGVDSLVFCHSHNAHGELLHHCSPLAHNERITQPTS